VINALSGSANQPAGVFRVAPRDAIQSMECCVNWPMARAAGPPVGDATGGDAAVYRAPV